MSWSIINSKKTIELQLSNKGIHNFLCILLTVQVPYTRGSRSSETQKGRRKHNKLKKRMKTQQNICSERWRWSELVKQIFCVRLKQSKEIICYQEEESGLQLIQDMEAEHSGTSQGDEYEKEKQKKYTERKYTEIADDVNNQTLLLPSVPVPYNKQPYSFVASVLNAIEQQRGSSSPA